MKTRNDTPRSAPRLAIRSGVRVGVSAFEPLHIGGHEQTHGIGGHEQTHGVRRR